MSIQIKDLNHLKRLCNNDGEPLDCFISLGAIRSSNAISYCPKDKDKWYVLHEIDGTEDTYETDEELLNPANNNIGKALDNGALFAY